LDLITLFRDKNNKREITITNTYTKIMHKNHTHHDLPWKAPSREALT